ncbi:MAG: hypothetical protein U0W24_24045 [Bacteroidales bacterium]
MKRFILALSVVFAVSLVTSSTFAQNKEDKKKEKKIVIKMEKEENGKITKIDTTIVLKEGENPDMIFKEYGIEQDNDKKQAKTYKIKIDDGDTSKLKTKKEMVWVTAEGDDDTIRMRHKHGKRIVVISDDDAPFHTELDGNVMVWNDHPSGNVYRIREFNGNPGDSDVIEKHIIVGDDMDDFAPNAFEFHGNNQFGRRHMIVTDDIQGPPMFFSSQDDGTDSTIVIVKKYKDGKEIMDNKRVIRNEKKEKHVMIKVTGVEKSDLSVLKLKENYKKLEVKDFSINMINEKLQVNFELANKSAVSFKILDNTGKAVEVEEMKQFPGKFSNEYEGLKGNFYIMISQDNKFFVNKVDIQVN